MPAAAQSQGGPFFRDLCTTITNPVTDKILCWEQTTALLKTWDGAAWVTVGPSAGIASLNGLTGALTILGTANQIGIVSTGSSITISAAQNISPSSSPTFVGLRLTGLIDGCLQTVAGLVTSNPCGGGGGGVTSINTTATGGVTIVGTTNRVTVGTSGSTLTLSAPQDLATFSSVTFNTVTATTMNTTALAATSIAATTVTATGNVQGPLRDKGGQVFNAAAYGMVCDDVTPTQVAFQAAIDAAAAVGGAVLIPSSPAKCRLTAPVTLRDAIKLKGDGWQRSARIWCDYTGTADCLVGPAAFVTMENVWVLATNLGFKARLLNFNPGLVSGVANRIVIRDSMFSGPADRGRTGATNSNTLLTGIAPNTTGLAAGMGISGIGIPLGTTILSVDSASQVTMSAPATATAAGVTLGFVTATSLISVRDVYDILIEGSTFFDAKTAIEAPTNVVAEFANDIKIRGNFFQSIFTTPPVQIAGLNWSLSYNTFEPIAVDGSSLIACAKTVASVNGLLLAANGSHLEGGVPVGTCFDMTGGAAINPVFIGNSYLTDAGVTSIDASGTQGATILDSLPAGAKVILTGATGVNMLSNQGATVVGEPTVSSWLNQRVNWFSTVPVWARALNTDSTAFRILGRPSDNVGAVTFYDTTGVTQLGFFQTTATGFCYGTTAGCGVFLSAATGNLGIGTGTASPPARLTVSENALALPALSLSSTSAVMQAAADDTVNTAALLDSFGSNNQGLLVLRHARGTPNARVHLFTGDAAGGAICGMGAYDGTSYSNCQALLSMFASEDWDATHLGADVSIGVTRPGSTSAIEAAKFSGIRGAGLFSLNPTLSGSRNSLGVYQIPANSFGSTGPTEYTHVTGFAVTDNDTTTYTGCTDPNAGGANPSCLNSGAGSFSGLIRKNLGPGFTGIGGTLLLETYDTRTGAAGTVEDDQVNLWSTMVSNSGRAVSAINLYPISIRVNATNSITGIQAEMVNFAASDAGSVAFNAKPGEEANRSASEGVMGDAYRVTGKNVRSAGSPVCSVPGITCFAGVIEGWVNAFNLVTLDQTTSLFRIASSTGETFINTPSGFTGIALHVRNNSGADGFAVSAAGDTQSLTATVTNLAGQPAATGVCVTTTGTLYNATPILVSAPGTNIDNVTLFKCF